MSLGQLLLQGCVRVMNDGTGLPSSAGWGVNIMPCCCVVSQVQRSLTSLPTSLHLSEFSICCLLYDFQSL